MFSAIIRKILSCVIVPLTGWLQRIDLTDKNNFIKKIVQLLSWFCQGVITLAYPCMGYNPFKSRREEASRQWTSEILQKPSANLEAEAKEFLEKRQSLLAADRTPLKNKPTFTVLICFHHHLQFFKSCVDSVKEACLHSPETTIEILIVNDDPSIDSKYLLKEISTSLEDKIVFHTNKNNLGICQSTNQAIARAQGEWILHLDCDDRLAVTTFSTLTKAITSYPTVRFISSRAIDIDEQGHILSWRLRSEKPSDLIANNFASHLKAIKKSLHNDLGAFNGTFEGCQDYEFALRTAINEPLLFIPDYLYEYRWHDHSQTVSHNSRQNLTAARIRQTYLLTIHWLIHGTNLIHWTTSGSFAQEWQQHLLNGNSKSPYEVSLEVNTPYNEQSYRLLLVQIATIIIDRHREKNRDLKITMNLNP